jgi:ribonuclease VapC
LICLDTSALMAVLMDEPNAAACRGVMEANDLVISAGTLSEAYLVAAAHRLSDDLKALVERMSVTTVEVDALTAHRIGEVWKALGKGRHPAALNFGDCFAYELASQRKCPLLFVGQDFAKTDIVSAL